MIAPHYGPWAFVSLTLFGLSIGMMWLVVPEMVRWLFRRLWPSDLAGWWVTFALMHHVVFFLLAGHRAVLDSPFALPLLAAWFWGYVIVRSAPGKWRNKTAGMVIGLAGWAWMLGAGFQFTERMEQDLALLPQSVQGANHWPDESHRLVAQALFISRLPSPERDRLEALRSRLISNAPAPLPLRQEDWQALQIIKLRLEDEQSRLESAVVLQAVLLAALILAWGLARKPDPNLYGSI